uniref:Flap endonuclease 1 n=1 Tax=Heliothis virescens TaxID=7102 RepID=A0A2A4IZZ0_HELVI
MGILGLSKLIADIAPHAIKEMEIKNYFGRKIAIDAYMSLYQFLIAVRSEGSQLVSTDGETTSHLMGTFYRTIRLVENGIKPVYVFDGKPPDMKSHQLNKRAERREEAEKELQKATEAGDQESIEKFNRRLVKVTKVHNEEARQLLKLMGIPVVEAPCEAEAQCAALVKAGKVFASATEDMDALTFGTNVLLRHLTFSEARKMPVQEFHLDDVLQGLGLEQKEFIDLCILLGCDYCGSIRGIGPKRAIELIRQHRSLEEVLRNIDTTKYPPPEEWDYERARELFLEPEVADPKDIELKWSDPDEEGLVKFLCGDKQFNEERVRNGAKKLMKARSGTTQGRLDGFFTISTTPNPKRKAEEDKKNAAKKKPKTGGGGRGRDQESIEKFNRRLVKVTKVHNEEARQLLKLMGIPVVEAPCEAEAQCAALVKAGKVFASATEDMDALTFGTNVLLRHLTFSEARKMPVQEFHLDDVLQGLGLEQKEFIDLCILLGCDYCGSIRGIGPKRAIELIRQHRSLEEVLRNIDTTKYPPPEEWDYERARELFLEPEVADPKDIELKWSDPDEEGLVKFLCGDKQFNEERVRNGAKKLMKARSGTTQGRLDGFFTISTTPNPKRKAEEDKKNAAKKKPKTGGGGRGRRPK